MSHRSDRTGTLLSSSRPAELTRKARKSRRSLTELVPSALEPLEERLLLTTGPSNVLVIYNQQWAGDQDANGVQDSLQVARYYAQVHGVPEDNLLGVDGGTAFLNSGWETWATTPYTNLYNKLITPLVNKLNTLGPNNINVLLFCYGLNDKVASRDTSPSGISLDDGVAAPFILTPTSGIPELSNPYMDRAPGFDAMQGRFNHQYTVRYNSITSPLYLVSRLDGMRGLWDALEEIDQAQYAQKYLYPGAGYFNGTVYVDNRADNGIYTDAYLQASVNVQNGYYYSYGSADENIAQSEHYLLSGPLPWKWQNTGALIGTPGAKFTDGTSAEAAPNALFYGGWYAPGGVKNFSWLPGSVGDDLDSYSLIGLEGNGTTGAMTPQIGKGLTAVTGVIGEPYVDGHPRPNIMMYYLLQGYSFAEAAMLCTPYLGWMGLNVGDPLYTPLDPNKTPAIDTTAPTPESGFNPGAGWWDLSGNYHLNLSIDNTASPEVASAVAQFGETTSYGSTVSNAAYWRRPDLVLTGVTAGLTYHMQLTLTDAVGNTWTSGDYTFTVPPKTIIQDSFTGSGSMRYKKPTFDATGAAVKWDWLTWGSGSANETNSTASITGKYYCWVPLTTSTLQTTAGTYTLTADINSTGAADQWVALGFGKNVKVTTGYDNANAMAILRGPGGVASTYYGLGMGTTGHGVDGTVIGAGVDTVSIILTTDGLGGATVSFSDTAGLLPLNSGGALTPDQLANINDIFIGSNNTGAGTFSNLRFTFAPADTSTTIVTSSANPSDYNQSVTFTATVAAGHASTGTPGGTVTFMDGSATLGTVALDGSGVATYTTSLMAVGAHSITAVYGGDADHTGSTSPAVTQTVILLLPGAPGNLLATPGSNSIALSWDASTGNVDGYTVERSRDGAIWSTVQTLGPTARGWTDAMISPVPTYTYRVSAQNVSGSSAYSTVSANALGVLGDCTADGLVDQADYAAYFNHYGMSGAALIDGDMDGSGVVDQADYALYFNNYGGGSQPGGTAGVIAANGTASSSRDAAIASLATAIPPAAIARTGKGSASARVARLAGLFASEEWAPTLNPSAIFATDSSDDFSVWDFFAGQHR